MKKSIALVLCLLSIVCTIPFATSATVFDDVPDGKWYTEGIEFCYENGYMAGVSDKVFDRNGTLTRAMFVTILASLDNADTSDFANKAHFTDVTPGKWYSGAVNWAFENGLASGLGEGIFGYKNPVTREQIAVFMLAYAEFSNNTHPERNPFDTAARADLSAFDDFQRIHSWALDGVKWAVACSLISGTTETTLDPRGFCTRAQAAVIIRSFMRDIEKKECEHVWVEPDCYNDGYCLICGKLGKLTVGHNWAAPDCENNAYCLRCNSKGEPALGHDWIAPDCESDGYCSRCGEKSQTAIGHDWIPPVCESDGYCSRCNKKGEAALGHDWIAPDCENDGYCSRCDKKSEPALGHSYMIDEDDTTFKTCELCGDITCTGEHRWIDATCTKDGYCALCKDFYESAKGHKIDEYDTCVRCGGEYDPIAGCFHEWVLPDCYNDGYCTICKMKGESSDGHEFENGECNACGLKLCNHSWADATCTRPIHCSLCGEEDPESEPLGHHFAGSMFSCIRCRMIDDPSLSAHTNLIANIQYSGSRYSSFEKALVSSSDEFETILAMNSYSGPVYVISKGIEESGRGIHVQMELTEQAESFSFSFESGLDGEIVSAIGIISKDRSIELSELDCDKIDPDEARTIIELEVARLLDSAESTIERYTNVSLADYGFIE